MLISQIMPDITWSIQGVSSPWIFASPTSRLTDGRPRVGCRISRTSGTGTIFDVFGTWATPYKPKLIALLGMSENAEGLEISLAGRDPSTLSYGQGLGPGSSITPRRLADGSVGAIYIVPDGFPAIDIDGLRFRWPTSAFSAFTVGQIIIAGADEWTIRRQWSEVVNINAIEYKSINQQPYYVRRVQNRVSSVTICPQTWERGYTSTSLQTMQELQSRLSERQPVLVIPALRPPGLGASAPIDDDIVNRTALFGRVREIGPIESVDNSTLLQMRLAFEEAPAGRIEG